MTHVFFEMELIGDNYDWAINNGSQDWRDLLRASPGRPGVWAVRSVSPGGRCEVKVMPGRREYSRANSKGSRGVYQVYELPVGLFYVVHRRYSWKRSETTFCVATESGVRDVPLDHLQAVCSSESYQQRAEWVLAPRELASAPAEGGAAPPAQPWRRPLGCTVMEAAEQRIRRVFDDFPEIYLSFSAGKDSTVLLHIVAAEARRRGRKFGLLLIDLEAQYRATVEHAEAMFAEYKDVAEPYWLALPLSLRNSVSQFEPQWMCWDPARREDWVRQPPKIAYVDDWMFREWFRPGMEFEELVEEFGRWYGKGRLTCCLVGIRTDESLNRWRAIVGRSTRFQGLPWTTMKGPGLYNAYPIYDWRTADIWTFHAQTNLPYNQVYDLMHLAGVPLAHMRICQPFGDDQKRGLWLYHLIEPDTWARLLTRVAGVNGGGLYSLESGAMTGRIRVPKPEHMSWREFSLAILETLPPEAKAHYEAKIGVFLSWWRDRGFPHGIPDEADAKEEAARKAPSWRRVARVLLKNDWWCKGLSFSQHVSDAYERYIKVKKSREAQWRHLLTN